MFEEMFLDSDNAESVMACDWEPFELATKPGVKVRIARIPFGEFLDCQERSKKGSAGTNAANKKLVLLGVVNSDGSPVYSSEKVDRLFSKGSTPLVVELLDLIVKRNNPDKFKAEVDGSEKN